MCKWLGFGKIQWNCFDSIMASWVRVMVVDNYVILIKIEKEELF